MTIHQKSQSILSLREGWAVSNQSEHVHNPLGIPVKIIFNNLQNAEKPIQVNLEIGDHTIFKNVPLTSDHPTVHIGERNGGTGLNVLIETTQDNKGNSMMRSIVIARENDPIIINDVTDFRLHTPVGLIDLNRLPSFMRSHPELCSTPLMPQ